MEFVFTDSTNGYERYFSLKIKDCICKHVLSLNQPKAQKVYHASSGIGYEKVIWGYGSGLYKHPELNRTAQICQIQKMIYKGIYNPIRCVIDKNSVLWIDNLHGAISNILTKGDDVKLEDCQIYIVDMRNDIPKIVDVRSSVIFDKNAINGCLKNAQDRINRISLELYEINYTIGEFMKDNRISWDAMTLDKSRYFNAGS